MAKVLDKLKKHLSIDSAAGKVMSAGDYKAHVIAAMEAGEEPLSRAAWEKKQKSGQK